MAGHIGPAIHLTSDQQVFCDTRRPASSQLAAIYVCLRSGEGGERPAQGPRNSTQGSSTLNPQLHGTLHSNMRPWFKNASAYSTSTCPSHSNMHISHSKMPKSPVRAEISFPEAQIFCVERFLRDLFNTPSHGSVCAGGRHQNRVLMCVFTEIAR